MFSNSKKVYGLIICLTGIVYAHQVVHEAKPAEAITVKIGYDDGSAMSYAETKVFSPHDREIEYQNGRTDKNGCFSFTPDDTGTWTAVINDGTGHGGRIEIPVKKNMEVDFVHHGYSPRQKILMGICVIWATIATSLLLEKRRLRGQKGSRPCNGGPGSARQTEENNDPHG